MVEAGSCSSDSTPSLGTSICHRCGPKIQAKLLHENTQLVVRVLKSTLDYIKVEIDLLAAIFQA